MSSSDGRLIQNNCLTGTNKGVFVFIYCQKVETVYICSIFDSIFGWNMEENGTYTLDLKQFRQLFPVSDCLSMGDDICVVNVRYDQNLKIMGHPCRFDGFLAVFCMSGGLRLTVNMTEFDLMKDSLFINLPGNIIRVSRPDVQGMEKLNFLVIAMTREFMGGFKVNMPKLIEKGMMLMSNPCIVLNEDEKAMARKYLRLAADVLKSNMMYKRESISSLISSVFFLAGGIMEQRVMEADSALPGRTDRSKVVFDQFLNLVADHHTKERGMAFYADKMCLTPKYLSKLVKTASGKSAPDWIDSFVILEAKNMLRYSDIPIKEIVSRLNFPNPSTFHKFFKLKTGMTPLQYRKS